MTLLPSGNTEPDYDMYRSDAPDPHRTLATWHMRRAAISNQKFRIPAKLAADRIGLSDARCVDLNKKVEHARDMLLNRPSHTTFEQRMGLEERLLRLEEQLHTERVRLWKDLFPLVTQARDASVESMRNAFLTEFTRQSNTGEQSRYANGGERLY